MIKRRRKEEAHCLRKRQCLIQNKNRGRKEFSNIEDLGVEKNFISKLEEKFNKEEQMVR